MAKAALRQVRVPERVVQQHVVEAFRRARGYVLQFGTTRRRGDYHGTMQTLGAPDVYALLPPPPLKPGRPGCGVWTEVKAEGGRLRPEQLAFREACLAIGVPHIIGGLDDVLVFLVEGGWIDGRSLPHYRRASAAQDSV